jgi:hypothetical protein
VSYKFNGASIDYTKTKTIQIADFPVRSSYVWGPMEPLFNNQLRDQFSSAKYGKKYAQLDEDHQKIVKEAIPQNISEAEPKDVSKGKK